MQNEIDDFLQNGARFLKRAEYLGDKDLNAEYSKLVLAYQELCGDASYNAAPGVREMLESINAKHDRCATAAAQRGDGNAIGAVALPRDEWRP